MTTKETCYGITLVPKNSITLVPKNITLLSGMESDTDSNTTVYITVSQFNNSDIETPDEFANSEPSQSTFSQPTFQPLHSQLTFEPPSTPSPISNETPTFSPLTSEPSGNNSSVNTQISHELDNFITLQQQLQHPQTLTIHHFSQSIISSNPSIPTPSSNYPPSPYPTFSSNPSSSSTSRAYRTFKGNSPILHFPLTQEQPKHMSITHSTLTLKNSSKYVYPFPPIHLLSLRP